MENLRQRMGALAWQPQACGDPGGRIETRQPSAPDKPDDGAIYHPRGP